MISLISQKAGSLHLTHMLQIHQITVMTAHKPLIRKTCFQLR